MSNLTMTIQIEAPELVAALTRLAAAVYPVPGTQTPDLPQPQTAVPVPPPAPAAAAAVPAPVPVPTVPQPPAAVPVTAPPAPAVPVVPSAPAAVPAVPVAAAPAYTLDQIARAGAALVDAGKREPLQALLAKYGVQAVTQLPPAQYGAFATELRQMGGAI